MTGETTARSSFTVLEGSPEAPIPQSTPSGLPSHSLNDEIADEIERYADDIAEPTEKSFTAGSLKSRKTKDPNLVNWDGPDDPANPQNWTHTWKWIVTCTCVLISLNASYCSSAPTSATEHIILAFGINAETSYTILTLYLLGFVFGPIIWGPGSELIGRRPILIMAMVGHTLFNLPQALAKNIQTLLIGRFLSGTFAVAPVVVSGGAIADVWPALGRGPATCLFSASVFLGPVLGPLVSGFIADSNASWRWIFWVMVLFAGFSTAVVVIVLPETYAPVILSAKAKRLRKADPEGNKALYAEHEKADYSVHSLLRRTIYRPFKMLFVEPILILITIYISFVYGILYALFEALPIIFVLKRDFTTAQVGMIYIGVGIGTTLGSVVMMLCSLHYPALVQKWRGYPPPEDRLYGAMIAAPCLVIGAFWMGWTGQYSTISWAAPAVSLILIGLSISLIFMSFLSYVVDTYLTYSASAFAINTLVRSAVAAAFPLFTVQMYTKMGVNWASTLLGLVSLLLAPCPFLFYKYGATIRLRSKFAPCIDLKIAKELAAESLAESKPLQV